MKKSVEYLDAVKAKLDLPSDYALAKVLGITREAVSGLRNGKSAMGLETSMKVAEILCIDEHLVYSDGQLERAKSPEIKHFWLSLSEKFSTSFDSLMLHANPRRIYVPAR